MIPVDIVTNSILLTTCHTALSKQQLHIYNCAASDQNPCPLVDYADHALRAYDVLQLNQRITDTPYIDFISNPLEFDIKSYLHMGLPIKLLEWASSIPYLGTKRLKKSAEDLKKIKGKIDGSIGLFDFFMNGDWRYWNRKIYKITAMLSPEEFKEFQCDCRRVDYRDYLLNYIKGMAIWVLKEDKVHPDHKMR